MPRPPLFSGTQAKASRLARSELGGSTPVVDICERYRRTGCHQRLCLWVQHRDLRPVFNEIEKQEKAR